MTSNIVHTFSCCTNVECTCNTKQCGVRRRACGVTFCYVYALIRTFRLCLDTCQARDPVVLGPDILRTEFRPFGVPETFDLGLKSNIRTDHGPRHYSDRECGKNPLQINQ